MGSPSLLRNLPSNNKDAPESIFPSSMHIVQLASGKAIAIYLYYDRAKFSLDRMEEIEDLEDLNFIFHTNELEIGGSKFVLQSDGMSCEWRDYSTGSARFRVGAVLSAVVGERKVISQSRGAVGFMTSNNQNIVCVQIFVQRILREALDRLESQFIMESGKRPIEVDRKTGGKTTVFPSQEVSSLCSPYCFNLFFGKFVVPSEPLRFRGINEHTLKWGITLAAYGRKSRMIPKWTYSLEIVRFLDQFQFYSASIGVKMRVVNRILLVDQGIKDDTLIFIDYLRDDIIRRQFFDRFVLVDCLNSMMRVFVVRLSPPNLICLSQRMADLSSVIHQRSKIRFLFSEGEIVCSLLNDVHPRAIASLISLINSRSYSPLLHNRTSSGNLLLVDLPSPLDVNLVQRVNCITTPIWLAYNTSGISHRLHLHSGPPVQGTVLGTVIGGIEYISTASKLKKVTVAQGIIY